MEEMQCGVRQVVLAAKTHRPSGGSLQLWLAQLDPHSGQTTPKIASTVRLATRTGDEGDSVAGSKGTVTHGGLVGLECLTCPINASSHWTDARSELQQRESQRFRGQGKHRESHISGIGSAHCRLVAQHKTAVGSSHTLSAIGLRETSARPNGIPLQSSFGSGMPSPRHCNPVIMRQKECFAQVSSGPQPRRTPPV